MRPPAVLGVRSRESKQRKLSPGSHSYQQEGGKSGGHPPENAQKGRSVGPAWVADKEAL